MNLLVQFIDLLVTLLWVAILGRVIMSWVAPRGGDPLTRLLHQITEPILEPIRRILPQTGMFDLSPMIVLLLLSFVWPYLRSALVIGL